MNKYQADKVITEHLKLIYGYAVKHCKNLQDAEDLSQEIAVKVYKFLLRNNDIDNIDNLIWRIAHNALCNYYRDNKNYFLNSPIDAIVNTLADDKTDLESDFIMHETFEKMRSEIAYLSKLQRHIVIAYYYENKMQADIASELNIPLGTVKWHLFEAKKELKKGMEKMRNSSELKFNPIKFLSYGFSGSISNFSYTHFKSALSQNIVYSVWKEEKSINEIADDLGVSPVYVESEVEVLLDCGFIVKNNNKFLCNVLLEEPTNEFIKMTDEMYKKASENFSKELFDNLYNSDIWKKIYGGHFDNDEKDKNFIMWALLPYIISFSGENLVDKSISFDEVATYRPDGSYNICTATVMNSQVDINEYDKNCKEFFGPWMNSNDRLTICRTDTLWSGKRIDTNNVSIVDKHLRLLKNYLNDVLLTDEEYAYLSEQGYLTCLGSVNDLFKASFQCVYINEDTKNELLAIGDKLKEKYWNYFNKLKKPCINKILAETPKHLQKMQKYFLRYHFYSDSAFTVHCLNELVESGKLIPPKENQKKALHTIIIGK
ncbi:MAG: sigma-70 family RNA polymerase sigma factor [Eubacterium sp.]|nr:sigma-70 family RNA polymerase sigma factor [Eubacterium sp.]